MAAAGSLYGFDVATDAPLARLRPGPGSRGRLSLELRETPVDVDEGTIVHEWFGPSCTFRMSRGGAALRCSCSVTGTFVVDAKAGRVAACPRRDRGTDEMWEHRMVGTAFPLLLAERGDLVVHAAALDVGGRALLFVGPTGRGKSTLAVSAPAAGYRIVAEDGADVSSQDGAVVWPGPLGVRIRADVVDRMHVPTRADPAAGPERKATHFLPRDAYVDAPVPLAAVVVLDERSGAGLRVTRLDPASAVPALLPSLIYGGSDRLADAFRLACRAADDVPVFRASMPDDLDAAVDALRELVALTARREPAEHASDVPRDELPTASAVAADRSA